MLIFVKSINNLIKASLFPLCLKTDDITSIYKKEIIDLVVFYRFYQRYVKRASSKQVSNFLKQFSQSNLSLEKVEISNNYFGKPREVEVVCGENEKFQCLSYRFI